MPTKAELEAQIKILKASLATHEETAMRYNNLFNASLQGILIEEDGIITDANPAIVRMFGYQRDDILGKSPLDFIHPNYHAIVMEEMQHTNETSYSVVGIHKDGHELKLDVLGRNEDYNERMVRVVTVHDVTNRLVTEQEHRERTIFADALRKSTAVLNSSLSVEEVMQHILANVGHVVNHDAANIMIIDGEHVVAKYWRGYPTDHEEFFKNFRLTHEEFNKLGNILNTKQSFRVDDTHNTEKWILVDKTKWVRSYACAPILLDDNILGFINLDSAMVEAFTDKDLAHLDAFADQAAVAINNATLFEQLKKQTDMLQTQIAARQLSENKVARRNLLLETLNQISRVAFKDLTETTIFNHVARLGALALDGTSCYICDWKESDGTSTVVAEYYAVDANEKETVSDLGHTYNLIEEFDHPARWIRDPRGYTIDGIDREDTPPSEQQHIRDYGGYIILTVPIWVQEEPIGYIEVWDSRPGRDFSKNDINMLKAIARQVSGTINIARLHNALKDSEMQNHAIINALPDLLFRVNADGVYTFAKVMNDSSILPEHIQGKTLYDMMPKRVAKQGHDKISAALATNDIQVMEYQIFEEQVGKLRDYEARMAVCGDDEVLVLVRDITRRKRFIEELAHARDQALEASRIKSQFLANISHELRTPLNSIINYTQLMLDGIYGDLSSVQQERLERVNRNGRNLLVLINDVLDLSKIESGQMTLKRRRIDSHEFITNILDVFYPMAHNKNLTLEYVSQKDAGSLPDLYIDEVRARQVLTNVIGNALKFTNDGSVTIHTEVRQTQLCFVVKDTGIGIAQDTHHKIFDEFRQGDNSSTRKYDGTGLGLAISKRITEMHGGDIWFDSELGKGSSFYITFPIATIEETEELLQ